jgi:hypothetical protein
MGASGDLRQGKKRAAPYARPWLSTGSDKRTPTSIGYPAASPWQSLELECALQLHCHVRGGVGQTELQADIH